MDLHDLKRKSIIHVPDELVGDVGLIRYDDSWWIKQTDRAWWFAHEEGPEGEITPVPPAEHSVTGPYLDLTPGMGEAIYNADGTKVEDEETEDPQPQ